MNADKKPEKDVPGMVVPETTVAGLPPEISSSYPAATSVIDPNAEHAPYIKPAEHIGPPAGLASMPPVDTLGDGSTIIDLDARRKLSEGSAESGTADSDRVSYRQEKINALKRQLKRAA